MSVTIQNNCPVIAIDGKTQSLWCAAGIPGRVLPITFALSPEIPDDVAHFFVTTRRMWGIKKVVYEDCYQARARKTYAQLYEVKERVRAICYRLALDFVTVPPDNWQRPMLLVPGEKGRIKSEERKRRSRLLASRLVGSEIKNDDLSDAICLWHHATGRTRLQYRHLTKRGLR